MVEVYHVRRDQLTESFKTRRDAITDSIRQRGEQLQEGVKAKQEQLTGGYRQGLEQLQQELGSLREKQAMLMDWASEWFSPAKRRLLRGNPGALSRTYQDAMERLREWMKK